MWDLAYHDVSILHYIVGRPATKARCFRKKDWAIVYLDFGVIQTISYVSWLGGPKTRLVELVSPDESLRVVFDDLKVVFETTPLATMVKAFLSKKWDRSTVEDGLAVMKVLAEAEE